MRRLGIEHQAGLITRDELHQTLLDMKTAMDDPDVLVIAPRICLVWLEELSGFAG